MLVANRYYVQVWTNGLFQHQIAFETEKDQQQYIAAIRTMEAYCGAKVFTINFDTNTKDKS